MRKLVGLLLAILFVLVACTKKEEADHRSSAADSAARDTTSVQAPVDQGIEIPVWLENLPHRNGYLYASGWGKSLRANISKDKALLIAQNQLARRLQTASLASTDSVDQAGSAGAQAQENGTNIALSAWKIVKQKQVKKGKYWYTFVLLELPLDN